MIIIRAPLRISFAGGGSDLPAYCERAAGAVISMTINKYVYVAINPKFDNDIRLSYSKTEIVNDIAKIEHNIARACLTFMNITGGLEIVTIADIPSGGTGLGSSSSFTTALLHGLHAYKGDYISKEKLAEETCHIEITICGAPIGRQDQYAAAYGGINYMQFKRNGQVDVTPIICADKLVERLQRNLLLFYTGRVRNASEILKEQSARSISKKKAHDNLDQMVKLANDLRSDLQRDNLDSFGPILHENWLLKRELADQISDSTIDDWYERARKAGAEGGKILGAGGGGFMLFYAPVERHAAIIHTLPELKAVSFAMERNGSSVIFYHP